MIRNQLYRKSLEKLIPFIETERKAILITGASGLIGSTIVDLFMLGQKLGKDNHIFALGRSQTNLESRFSEYLSQKNFHILEQDICNPLPQDADFDYIIHGASNADPTKYAKFPVETMLTNLQGGINILEYGRSNTKCKITILSTFEVYGNVGKDSYEETDAGVVDINALRSCYPESKRALEVLARSYHHEYGVHVNVARLCSIFGPTMSQEDSKAHAQFLWNAVRHQNIALKSDGSQRRTYCYVNDAITAILCILFHGKEAESFNVCNENCVVSISELAALIAKKVGVNVVFESPSEFEQKAYSKTQNCILDNSKLRELRWKGQYTINEAIDECIDIMILDQENIH